jgi:organic hydroperoxide reductase OsmC/OhrA
VIYTAKTHTTGGRENGLSRSSDGLTSAVAPRPRRASTNPEQLFAAGWSAASKARLD